MAAKYPSISPYVFVANSPLMFIDPDGKKIKGVNKQDAQKFFDDVNTVFSDSRFTEFRSLIKIDKSGQVFEKISPNDFFAALQIVN